MSICMSLGNSAPAKRVLDARGAGAEGYLEEGLRLNNCNKLSVYTAPCFCACVQQFKEKKTQGLRPCRSISQFKIEPVIE